MSRQVATLFQAGQVLTRNPPLVFPFTQSFTASVASNRSNQGATSSSDFSPGLAAPERSMNRGKISIFSNASSWRPSMSLFLKTSNSARWIFTPLARSERSKRTIPAPLSTGRNSMSFFLVACPLTAEALLPLGGSLNSSFPKRLGTWLSPEYVGDQVDS